MSHRNTDARLLRRALPTRKDGQRGAAAVEFALCIFPLMLIVCGIIDFGLAFGGRYNMEDGVDTAARTAAIGAVSSGPTGCTAGSGVSTATAYLVCDTVADAGSVMGTSAGITSVGICIIQTGSTASSACKNQTTGTTATSSSSTPNYDVEVCASATAASTTGLTSKFLNGVEISSSRQIIEQYNSSNVTPFGAFNGSTSTVTFNGATITGTTCT